MPKPTKHVEIVRIFLLLAFARMLSAQTYDVVLQGGRVLDPESGLDGVRNIGIIGNRIAAVSTRPIQGKVIVNATGLDVAPGFIDLHSHGQDDENYRFKALDGVTTALELELGASPVAAWYSAREGKARVNFGASAGPIPARMAVMGDTSHYIPRDAALNGTAAPEQQATILAAVQKDLNDGGLGVGLGIEFAPKQTPTEVLDLFYAVAKWHRPIFLHLRRPGDHVIESLQEVIADAAVAGVPIHVMHINGTGGMRTMDALRMVDGARARGLDVTTEIYPYIAGSAPIESGLFDPGWQENRGITYSDLMWVATGERLTSETFDHYRRQGGRLIMFLNSEETVRNAMRHPMTIVASDGLLTNGQGHPRGAGTYARILGKYVREDRVLSLMEAIRKCSLLPAQRLEMTAPQMRHKGRLKVGADADVTVFDPAHVIDKATFERPGQFSEGFRYVLVNGQFVVRDGKLEQGVFPGKAVRAPTIDR